MKSVHFMERGQRKLYLLKLKSKLSVRSFHWGVKIPQGRHTPIKIKILCVFSVLNFSLYFLALQNIYLISKTGRFQ